MRNNAVDKETAQFQKRVTGKQPSYIYNSISVENQTLNYFLKNYSEFHEEISKKSSDLGHNEAILEK